MEGVEDQLLGQEGRSLGNRGLGVVVGGAHCRCVAFQDSGSIVSSKVPSLACENWAYFLTKTNEIFFYGVDDYDDILGPPAENVIDFRLWSSDLGPFSYLPLLKGFDYVGGDVDGGAYAGDDANVDVSRRHWCNTPYDACGVLRIHHDAFSFVTGLFRIFFPKPTPHHSLNQVAVVSHDDHPHLCAFPQSLKIRNHYEFAEGGLSHPESLSPEEQRYGYLFPL